MTTFIKRIVLGRLRLLTQYALNIFFTILTLFRKEIVLVLTIGKVGSTSVYRAIRASRREVFSVFHVHSLNLNFIRQEKVRYLASKRGYVPFHLFVAEALLVSKAVNQLRLRYVILFREPLEREISSYFQDWINYYGNFKNLNVSRSVEELDALLKRFEGLAPEDIWVDREIYQGLNLDMYDIEWRRGDYIRATHEYGKVVAFRIEDVNICGSIALEWLLSTPIVTIGTLNSSKTKIYREVYREVSKTLRASYKTKVIFNNSEFVKKFYDEV